MDEFYRNELRESDAAIQELTSPICSGKLSHVPSQPAVVPSPRSMLSRDQSLRSDTWNLSGTQGNVFGNSRAVIDSSQIPYQGFVHSTNQRKPSIMNSFSPAEVPQLHFDKFPTPSDCNSTNSLIHNHSWFGKYDSKIKRLPVLIFHRKLCYGSKKWRWLIHWTS